MRSRRLRGQPTARTGLRRLVLPAGGSPASIPRDSNFCDPWRFCPPGRDMSTPLGEPASVSCVRCRRVCPVPAKGQYLVGQARPPRRQRTCWRGGLQVALGVLPKPAWATGGRNRAADPGGTANGRRAVAEAALLCFHRPKFGSSRQPADPDLDFHGRRSGHSWYSGRQCVVRSATRTTSATPEQARSGAILHVPVPALGEVANRRWW